MTFYEQKIQQFWTAHQRYLVERRRLFDSDEEPKNAPEEHERRMLSVIENYDAELEGLGREAVRDARRMNQEYQADPSRDHAWVQSRAAVAFADLIIWARQQLRNSDDEGAG